MHLQETIGLYVQGIGARVRRDAIAYAVCAVCVVAAVILATWASVLALLAVVGPVYAQLIVAGIFLLAALASILWLQIARSRKQAALPLTAGTTGSAAHRQAQFAQIAMIIEAVMLGYALSRRSERR